MMTEKTGLKSIAEGRRELFLIDPRKIKVEAGFNARDFSIKENQDHVDWLMASIVESGVKEPLTVRLKDGEVFLVNGESRLRAVLQAIDSGADIKTVPCQAADRHGNETDRVVELVTRNSGKQLTPIEQATVVKRLLAYGWDQTKVAKALAFSKSYISHLVALMTLPEETQAMVREGLVSAATAVDTVKAEGAEAGAKTLKEAATEAKAAAKANGKKPKKVTKKTVAAKKTKKKAKPMTRAALIPAADQPSVIDFLFYTVDPDHGLKAIRDLAKAIIDELDLGEGT